ncbi:MarR family transcriptional regulator [Chitinophaga lutea]|uniref:MarR family transcriptional regulator n=1 Tax=Chitinophaga lutea TaxID=2488634 RepID=A0A3N4QBK3_9BACT|nr:MarR family winged helix-turn-helix transcriptional regulator [Chitinophaga lutea]RPE13357.1 MarR family transcriptional regulator [Chitinophaga lutea]
MAKESTFNPEHQATNTASKVVAALERLSEAFRVLLWQEAKQHGISPIQVQILTYLLHYPDKFKTVTNLASHFNMTKATISDAIKSVESKGFLKRKEDVNDNRSHTLLLTREGKNIARKIEDFANPIQDSVNNLAPDKQAGLLEQLLYLIQDLNRNLVITPQRMCLNCRFYEQKGKLHYCNLVNAFLNAGDLRVDCPEFTVPV